jgi:Domain of unknown function (DUF4303)
MPSKGHPLPQSILDFEWMRSTLREGARIAFTHIVESHPSETFYAFALYSMSDHTGIYPAANSIDGFLQRLRAYRGIESFRNRPIRSFTPDLRWSTPEWRYEGREAPDQTQFGELYGTLNKEGNTTKDGTWAFADDEFDDVWAQFYLAMTWALSDLRDAGLFNKLTRNRSATIFATILDSPAQNWLEYRSAEYLNSATVFARFARDVLRSQDRNYRNELDNQLTKPSECHQAYMTRLQSASREKMA